MGSIEAVLRLTVRSCRCCYCVVGKGVDTLWERARFRALEYECYFQLAAKTVDNCS